MPSDCNGGGGVGESSRGVKKDRLIDNMIYRGIWHMEKNGEYMEHINESMMIICEGI